MSKARVIIRSAAFTRWLTAKSLLFPGFARGALLLLVAGLFSACLGVAADTVEGSQTHFLRRCSDGCGSGLECSCGVCTRPCSEASECTDLAAAASCVAAASSCESTGSAGSSCSVECGSDADCRNLGAAFSCSGGQCQAPELRLTSLRPALGEPCVPADETFADFSGHSLGEVNVETRGSCGNSNVCLVHEFQGRVTCPSGQSGLPGDRACATPDGVPVEVSVEPQLESRPAEQAVVCSCRCAGPTRGANYCSCPSGMRCEPLFVARGESDEEDLAGSYCVY